MTESILRIDVKAEIRKLTKQRFKSAGDYAVELVRWAAAQRPLRIDIEISSSRLSVTHDGQDLSQETLKRLVTLFDSSRPSSHRHRALVDLEEREGLALLAAFHPRASRVRIDGRVAGRRRGIEFDSSGMASSFVPGPGEGCTVTVRGRGRRPSMEKRLVEEACCYSLVPVRLNGKRINSGPRLKDTLVHVDLRNARLHGTIGLPALSDLTRIVRLKNGIREEEKIRPSIGGMIFHAVVGESDDDLDATWGTLRRAGRRLYQRLGKRFDELDESQRSRALKLLFDRYEATRDPALLDGVNAFKIHGYAPLDLAGVRLLARDREIFAVDPQQEAGDFDLEGRRVLRLDAMQRRFLEKELGTEILPPPPRFGLLGMWKRMSIRLRQARKKLLSVFGGGPGKPVRTSSLDSGEKAFLDIVSAEIRSGAFSLPGEARPFGIGVRMAQDQRRPWAKVERRDGRSEYRISRHHPLVEAMVAAVATDPSMVYPALVALTEGHDGWVDTRSVHQQAILARHGL